MASSAAAQPDERIEILDGLRGLAVLFVIGYHYFGQWAPPLNSVSLYPYGESLASVSYFRFGYLGVDLFFLVSGFVITLTLTRCSGPREFLARRFARLFPAMVLASSATFLIVRYLSPHFWTRKFCDFLPGLTFTDPWLFKQYVGIDCEFMDGAYWSLFVEVRFYFLVALLYFGWSRAAFLRNSAIFLSAAISVSVLEIAKYHLRGLALADLLLFPQYSPLLCCGIAFYFVWRDCSNRLAWFMVVEAFTASVGRSISVTGGIEWAFLIGIYALFTSFALRFKVLHILASGWLTRLGSASYTLYLLHQDIGVTLIAAIAAFLGIAGGISSLVGVLVAVGLALASIAIYDNFEVPARRFITHWAKQAPRRWILSGRKR